MTGLQEKSTPLDEPIAVLCRDCTQANTLHGDDALRCPSCHSPRLVRHSELMQLGVAHLDCDAFYAAVEKRDNPDLNDKPVIIGGGRRGVVSTCCYIARIHGVHSAMPMFKANKACPDAVIIKPDMEKYGRVGREVRDLMRELTPLVEPLSIDEAFMDLRGTERLHGGAPALSLMKLTNRIEKEIGITVSIGLSHNKFLAKLASDLNKPRGFSVIGEAETLDFLATLPVSAIWGVGKAMQPGWRGTAFGTWRNCRKSTKPNWQNAMTQWACGWRDWRAGKTVAKLLPSLAAKSISSETTFNEDLSDVKALEKHLWWLSEKTAKRCKAKGVAGKTVVLKMKADRLSSLTRNVSLPDPTQLADVMFEKAANFAASLGRASGAEISSYRHWRFRIG